MITKQDSKHELILKAAFRCFKRYGYNKTTMDDIAASVGMKKASLYYYYKNKEMIFSNVVEEEANRFIKIAQNKLSDLASASEKLSCLVATQLDYFRERVIFFDLSVQVMIEIQPIMDKLHKQFRQRDIDFLASILREGIKSGEFRACNPNRIADAIRALLDSLLFKEFQSAQVQSAADIDYSKLKKNITYILNLVLRGLKRQKMMPDSLKNIYRCLPKRLLSKNR